MNFQRFSEGGRVISNLKTSIATYFFLFKTEILVIDCIFFKAPSESVWRISENSSNLLGQGFPHLLISSRCNVKIHYLTIGSRRWGICQSRYHNLILISEKCMEELEWGYQSHQLETTALKEHTEHNSHLEYFIKRLLQTFVNDVSLTTRVTLSSL